MNGHSQRWAITGAALVVALGAIAAAKTGGAGQGVSGGASTTPTSASAPAAPTAVSYKSAPLPAGMEDFKTTETCQRTALKAGRPEEAAQPGFLGVLLENRNGKLSVATVDPDSPASKAGIAVGDIVVNLDGHVPADVDDFRDLVHDIAPGTLAHLAVVRDSKPVNVAALIVPVSRPLSLTAANERPMLGVRLNEEAGTRITGVDANSNAARADLRVGDVIAKVNDIALGDAVHLADVLANHKINDTVALVVDRDGTESVIRVPLLAAPDSTAPGRGGRAARGRAPPRPAGRRSLTESGRSGAATCCGWRSWASSIRMSNTAQPSRRRRGRRRCSPKEPTSRRQRARRRMEA